MKKEALFFTILAILWSVPVYTQPVVRIDSLFSPSLGRTKKYSVLLPKGYNAETRYATLYLLHGYSGGHTDWTSRTKLADYTSDAPLLIVMPDAENSWYTNSKTEPQRRFEDYLVKDLLPFISRHYSVDTTRMAIAGLSMGGYGALLLAFRYPAMFRFAGSLSGALSIPRDLDVWEKAAWGRNIAPSLRTAFGKSGKYDEEHDLFTLLSNSQKKSLPYFYVAIGTEDGFPTFLPANRSLTDSLRSYGVTYEYHETPGGHTWKYWDKEIRLLLKRFQEIMSFSWEGPSR